ncbi:MAG: dicarboxylate/amino acid:cation symporter [Planctomycetota bacterium]|nr:dicarboxylate/amino acid:cation symporter [Planctomycetota bacterium]
MTDAPNPAKKQGWSLPTKVLIGMTLGVAVGMALNVFWTPAAWAELGVQDARAFLAHKAAPANDAAGFAAATVRWIIEANATVGQLFINLLRFVAVPIVLFSLIPGVASLGDVRKLGRIGAKTMGLFLFTTVTAIIIGLVLVNTIAPWSVVAESTRDQLLAQNAGAASTRINSAQGVELGLFDYLLGLVPINPFEAMAKAEMLQVVTAAVLIGAALTVIPRERSAPVIAFSEGMNEALTVLIHWVTRLAPYAVFALLASVAATVGLDVLKALGLYCLVCIAGYLCILLILYPACLKVLSRYPLRRFFKGFYPAQIFAFSTSSSNATLPVTMQCCRERLGVSDEITSFVCPLGATVNMDGTALYQAISAVFLAHLFGVELSLSQQVTIVITSTLAAIGTPGIPGAGLVLLVVVLQSIGVPAEGIAIIAGVDRILNMCRTAVNVTGDALAACIVGSSEGQVLSEEATREKFPGA